jgi:hypothetical protein
MSIEDRFNAAVNVIKSLPKNGKKQLTILISLNHSLLQTSKANAAKLCAYSGHNRYSLLSTLLLVFDVHNE